MVFNGSQMLLSTGDERVPLNGRLYSAPMQADAAGKCTKRSWVTSAGAYQYKKKEMNETFFGHCVAVLSLSQIKRTCSYSQGDKSKTKQLQLVYLHLFPA